MTALVAYAWTFLVASQNLTERGDAISAFGPFLVGC